MVTATHSRKKPRKPYPSFALTAHPNGQWCKKIRGKVHFFGVWADPEAALTYYNRQAADLHEGREPRSAAVPDVPSVKDLANAYLAAQKEKCSRGLIDPRWFDDCLSILKAFTAGIGKSRRWDDLRPSDFAKYRLHLYDKYGVCSIERHITVIRSMLKHAYDADLIDRPIKFGQQLARPTAKEKRQSRNQHERDHGKRLFTQEQLLQLYKKADDHMKAMILLGINGGFGNNDCATLPIAAVHLEEGIIEYERPKTAMHRVVPLWPETTMALRTVLEGTRPRASKPEYDRLVFLTLFGNPWSKNSVGTTDEGEVKVHRQQAISAEFHKLLKRLNLHRYGLGFYALRHTFRTWADEVKDQHAVHRIMGHAIPGMSGIYVEEISLDRLRAVVNHVRSKIFSQ
jgi:integrase